MAVRPFRLLVGLALVLVGWFGVTTRVWGLASNLAQPAVGLAVTVAIFTTLFGLLLALNGVGLVTTESLRARVPESQKKSPTALQFGLVYLGLLAGGVVPALLLYPEWNADAVTWMLAYCGGVFILAACETPWWLYATIRRLGGFATIESDVWMKRTLAVLGTALLAFAAYLAVLIAAAT
jgi:hypothetical protein